MAIEIVDFPIKNSDFPVRYVKLPEGSPLVGVKHTTQDFSGQTTAIIAPFSAPGRTWSIPGPSHLWASRPMPPLGVSTVRPAWGGKVDDGFTPRETWL